MLGRRTFFGAGAAGVAGLLLPQKLKAAENEQWWEERDFDFEGTPCTEYLWPRDRLIRFENPLELNPRDCITTVPVFSPPSFRSTIEQEVRNAIRAKFDTHGPDTRCHIHVVKVRSLPDHVAILASDVKCRVAIDCFATAEADARKLIENRGKRLSVRELPSAQDILARLTKESKELTC